GAGARLLERGRIVEELADRRRETLEVARRDDPARAEPPHRLGDPADVVRDRRDAGAERLQQRPALVELRPVGKERDRRVAERTLDLLRVQIPEPPFDPVAALRAVAVDR